MVHRGHDAAGRGSVSSQAFCVAMSQKLPPGCRGVPARAGIAGRGWKPPQQAGWPARLGSARERWRCQRVRGTLCTLCTLCMLQVLAVLDAKSEELGDGVYRFKAEIRETPLSLVRSLLLSLLAHILLHPASCRGCSVRRTAPLQGTDACAEQLLPEIGSRSLIAAAAERAAPWRRYEAKASRKGMPAPRVAPPPAPPAEWSGDAVVEKYVASQGRKTVYSQMKAVMCT